jgi:hypothetical protein
MPTARPFAKNTGSPIAGTIQIGNLAIGYPTAGFESTGLKWWSGPDEDLGYVIAHEDLIGRPGADDITAYVGFWRTGSKTESDFIDLAEHIAFLDNDPQNFTDGGDAKDWLNANGYWTSYSKYIVSAGRTDTGGYQVGAFIDKDMVSPSNWNYSGSTVPGGISTNITASYWSDWGDDIFDSWGYFYLYDPGANNYLGLQFSSYNLPDGTFSTQSFLFNSRNFTIIQGYPVQGIFKFEIRVDDDSPFIFGEGGNMGSDGSTANLDQTYSYSIGGTNLTLWYNENYQTNALNERFYSYYVPFVVEDNATKTYTDGIEGTDNLYLYSVQCTNGLTVYHSKQYDVKEWVVYDLEFGE